MIKTTLIGLLSIAGMLVSPAGKATVIPWSATINQAQEVPPSGSLGTGSASGSVDDVSGDLAWNISFAGLTGPVTAMHFHGPAAPGVNAGGSGEYRKHQRFEQPKRGVDDHHPPASQRPAGRQLVHQSSYVSISWR
jgi:hypothetical protein